MKRELLKPSWENVKLFADHKIDDILEKLKLPDEEKEESKKF